MIDTEFYSKKLFSLAAVGHIFNQHFKFHLTWLAFLYFYRVQEGPFVFVLAGGPLMSINCCCRQ